MAFHASPRPTVGVEVELGLVEAGSLRLVPSASDLVLAALRPDGGDHPKVKHEFYSSSIEVITGICDTAGEAARDLADSFTSLTEVLDPLALLVQPGGGHPEQQWRELTVTDKPRYQEFATWIGWPARRSMCHGIHVHVGVNSGDAAVSIAHSLAVSIPLLLGPSASSPYWHGHDTGLASSRTKVFEGMPTADLPPPVRDYAQFENRMVAMQRAGAIRTVRELWWDIRPHPMFGTVESRVCDTTATLSEVVALAAFTQCLVADLNERFDAGEALPRLPRWALRENKWRAARWGVECDVITDESGSTSPLLDVLADELARLAPVAQSLGCAAELASLARVADDPGYRRQRRVFASNGSLHEVTADLVSQWAGDPLL